jgi:hypothetical protein
MINYKQIYCDYFDYCPDDVIPCEITGNAAVDIHHIINKGMGGSKKRDCIQNLMALNREKHDDAHLEKISKFELLEIHFSKLKPQDQTCYYNDKLFQVVNFCSNDMLEIHRGLEVNFVDYRQIKFML